MTYIIVIDKYGKVKDQKVKEFQEEDLYKKAGFKSKEGFVKQHTWKSIAHNDKLYSEIAVYAKTKGNAGKENKYEMPPPIDEKLYFGGIVIVNYDNNEAKDIRANEWKSICEQLMGGFESIDEESESEEEEEIEPSKLDKYGYEKDGFVVDDDDEEDLGLEYESELSEDEYFE